MPAEGNPDGRSPLDRLYTDRQVHIHLIGLYEGQLATLKRIEKFMADLTSTVAELQAAVDSVASRFAGQLAPLVEALAAAQAANTETEGELTDALANAQTAADAIGEQIVELNAIGAEPEVPVVQRRGLNLIWA